jgi:tRNA-dihydrouridine synthase B
MVGRGAYGNVWIFRQIAEYAATGKVTFQPTWADKSAMLVRHMDMLLELKGLHTGICEMRRHAVQYIKGVPGAAEMRARFNAALSREDFMKILATVDGKQLI